MTPETASDPSPATMTPAVASPPASENRREVAAPIGRRFALAAIVLTLVAGAVRLPALGRLGFYADEDTSAFAARSMALGDAPRMPTGMPYRRALPLTWLNAASARMLGADRELAYRLPSALLGILAIPVLMLAGRGLVGTRAALLAGAMLALCEWHIAFSRQARMYAPLVLFAVAMAWSAWRWAESGRRRDLLLTLLFAALALSLHQLGVLALTIALAPLAFRERFAVPPWRLIALVGGLAAAVLAYDHLYVLPAFRALPRIDPSAVSPIASAGGPELPVGSPLLAGLLVLCAALGGWIAARAAVPDLDEPPLRRIARVAFGIVAGGFAGLGQLYGAALCVAFVLALGDGGLVLLIRRAPWQTGAIALVLAAWSGAMLLSGDPMAGVRRMASLPHPLPVLLLEQSPGAMILFAIACLPLALRGPRSEERGLWACVVTVLAALLLVGLAERGGGGTRYLFPVLPFLLLAAAGGFVRALDALAAGSSPRVRTVAMLAAMGVVASGMLGGIGVPQAVAVARGDYGEPLDPLSHQYPLRPDHASAGRFLRAALRPGDRVIAEDPQEQLWYAGAADYWLRAPRDAAAFLYRGPDGVPRDIYAGAILLADVASVDAAVRSAATGRVWLVTSGETAWQRAYYLAEGQRRWLDSLGRVRAPTYVARDGVTRVYCLTCESVAEGQR